MQEAAKYYETPVQTSASHCTVAVAFNRTGVTEIPATLSLRPSGRSHREPRQPEPSVPGLKAVSRNNETPEKQQTPTKKVVKAHCENPRSPRNKSTC